MSEGLATASPRCMTDTYYTPKHACSRVRLGICRQFSAIEGRSSRIFIRTDRACNKRREARLPEPVSPQAEISQPYGPGTVRELPVFPLGVVAFPTGDVPLNIFEARYRVLFNTLLAGAAGIEEELVNYQKPWQGSQLFGIYFNLYPEMRNDEHNVPMRDYMTILANRLPQPLEAIKDNFPCRCYVSDQGMASIGTTLHILQHERLPDGRLFIVSKGVEKFKVLKVLEERPLMICQVQMLEDCDDRTQVVQELADHDIQLFKDLVMLNVKMNKRLEVSLEKRLLHEREILEASTKFLRAKVALQSAFTTETPAEDESISASSENPEEFKKPAEGSIAVEKSEETPDDIKPPDGGSSSPLTDPEKGSDSTE